MAVIQISKIQVRRGLHEDLPQLASGEIGWSSDQRRLFIGNGILGDPDYAPEIGNTEILTIYSPIGAALSNIVVIEDQITVLQSNVAAIESSIGTNLSNVTLQNNNVTASNVNVYITSTSVTLATPAQFDYKIVRGDDYRTGTVQLSFAPAGTPTSVVYHDEYVETADIGINFSFFKYGYSNVAVQYTSTNTGKVAYLINYTVKKF